MAYLPSMESGDSSIPTIRRLTPSSRHQDSAIALDATTGAHVWADRFEEEVADLFKLQDEVVARLANSLGYELVKAEANKSVTSKNPDAIDLELRGRALFLTRFQQGVDYRKIAQVSIGVEH
jgi:hypothetical protein